LPFLKTLLHYRVKHKSLKMLQLLYVPSCTQKNVNATQKSGVFYRHLVELLRERMSYFAVAFPVDEKAEFVDANETVELADSRFLQTQTPAHGVILIENLCIHDAEAAAGRRRIRWICIALYERE